MTTCSSSDQRGWFISILVMIAIALIVLGLMFGMQTAVVSAQDDPDVPSGQVLEYMGVRECLTCHRNLRAHAETAHGLALSSDNILADFTGNAVPEVLFPGAEAARPLLPEDIAYAVGSGRYAQRYLYALEDGGYLVLPFEWNMAEQSWQPFTRAESWPDPAYSWEENCAYCHTTGFDVDQRTWVDAGVQCESCHGPGSYHVELADDLPRNAGDEDLRLVQNAIITSPDPQICGQCHSSGTSPDGVHPFPVGYQPGGALDANVFIFTPQDNTDHWWSTGHARSTNMQFNEWMISAHAGAADSVRQSDYAAESCLECHSADYRQMQMRAALVAAGEREGGDPQLITVDDAQFGVTCTSCHYPHSSAGHDFNLVDESYALCTTCHTQPETDGIHHPVREMFEGTLLLAEVRGVPSAHFTAEGGPDCQTCHMAEVPIVSGRRISHAFNVILPGEVAEGEELVDTCTNCHTELVDAAGIQQLVIDVQSDTEGRLNAARAAYSSSSPEWVLAALDFVEGDGSLGLHNYAYVHALLGAAEQALGIVPPQITEAVQVTSTREVLTLTREATASDVIIAGFNLPMLIALAAGVLFLLLGLMVLLGKRIPFAVVSLLLGAVLVGGAISLREPPRTLAITGNDEYCLVCHADAGRTLSFPNNTFLNLDVDVDRLAASVHGTSNEYGAFGCVDCHGNNQFPHEVVSFSSRGAYRVEMSHICIDCHANQTAHYEAVLERNILVGCSNCHTSHYVGPASELGSLSQSLRSIAHPVPFPES